MSHRPYERADTLHAGNAHTILNTKGFMIGGLVLETIDCGNRVWVNCGEKNSTLKCAIYVERNPDSLAIRLGDDLWWQGTNAMWTPVDRRFEDRKIKRIGFSGVERPKPIWLT